MVDTKMSFGNYSLAFLGDITDNTSLAGFCKAKEILDQLEIPYIPIFGNHDVGTDEEYEKYGKWKGEDYFDQVFWSTTSIPCKNAPSTKNFETLLKEFNFERDETNKDYKNFSFNYGGFGFIGLDFVSREKFMEFGKGVGADADLNEINKNWLEKKLEEFKENQIILFAHHPIREDLKTAFSAEEVSKIIKIFDGNDIPFELGGHIHSHENWMTGGMLPQIANANIFYGNINKTSIYTTEALMVGSNGRGIERSSLENGVVDTKKGIVRIVKVFEKNNFNPYNWETTETGDEFLAFNPSLNFGFSLKRHLNFPCVEVEAAAFTEKPFEILWNFGDNTTSSEKEYTKCYNSAGKYKITLILKDKNSDFRESISKEVEVKEGIIPKTIQRTKEQIEKGIRFFSEKSQMFFDKIGEIEGKIKTWIFKQKSPLIPIGIIEVDFDKLQGDLKLENLISDVDFEKKKTILYMPQWPEEIKRSKVLFLPK